MADALTNVFLSWSGPRSRKMAEVLHGFLRRVIQSARPFHSDKDIESGAFWDEVIRTHLKTVKFAIICCTPENISAPWLNYEAGALAEGLDGCTAPLLLGARPEALKVSPLSRLQAREADEAGTLSVLRALNSKLPHPLDDDLLRESFGTHWKNFEEQLKAIPPTESKAPEERNEKDMLAEVVVLCRQIALSQPTGVFMPTFPTPENPVYTSWSRPVTSYSPFTGQGPQGAHAAQRSALGGLSEIVAESVRRVMVQNIASPIAPPQVVGEIMAELGPRFSAKELDEVTNRVARAWILASLGATTDYGGIRTLARAEFAELPWSSLEEKAMSTAQAVASVEFNESLSTEDLEEILKSVRSKYPVALRGTTFDTVVRNAVCHHFHDPADDYPDEER